MKLVRTFSMIIALAGASTVYADTPPAKAPAPAPEKKAPAPAPDKKAPAKAELSAAETAKVEAFFSEFYKAVMDNKDACAKMGPAMKVVLDKYLDAMTKMAESGKEPPQATKDKLKPKQEEMMSAVFKCKDDKGVSTELQRLMGAMMKAKKDSSAPAPAPAPAPPAKK
jgi:hypothetical protein